MNKPILFALLASSCLVASAGVAGTSFAAEPVPSVADGIGGVVTSAKGPEAGVWVIAETKELPTRYIKIVVTDDQGRYMLPQMPKGKYKVWVRGYGLVDSKPVDGVPGKNIDLTAMVAPNAKAAAEYYPANYWLSLIKPPAIAEFPGTGPQGNGIAPRMTTQQEWLAQTKNGCMLCHQQGEKATRELANNTPEGWAARIVQARALGDETVGNHGPGVAASMQNNMAALGRDRGLKMFADWTGAIAKGALPAETPPRPEGVERNVVVTLRDWSKQRAMHDEISTDRRNPTVNANGPVYALSPTTGQVEVLDPVKNVVSEIALPTPGGGAHSIDVYPHNPMVDQKGRLWVTDWGQYTPPPGAKLEQIPKADYCTGNVDNKFAKYFPLTGTTRAQQIIMYDPATKKMSSIPNCFGVHHLMFGRDKDNTLYFSGDGNVMGWLNTKVWDDTHDAQKAQGWCPIVLDTKERGVTKVALGGKDDVGITPDRTQWNQPAGGGTQGEGGGAAVKVGDPKKDTRISGFLYGMDVSAKDGSVWYAKTGPAVPTGIIRFDPGSNPPETCKSEYYEPPKQADGSYAAFLGRSVAVDSKGVAWVAYNSGKFGAFDRTKCKVLSGPTATGQHCPEGWTFYDIPGPRIAGTNGVEADWHYLNWVDLYDTFGLGKDVPMAPGSNSDSLIAKLPNSNKLVHFRVPYPMGFFGRGVDGRIDDPKAGWKGKGLWMAYAMTPAWHMEGGDEGNNPEVVHLQLRPDPLAH